MSKYKVGDKVVLEITDKIEMEEPWYILSDATSIYGSFMDKAAEPLTAYIEQARAEGAETAWELARKIYLREEEGGYSGAKLFEIFDKISIGDIYRLTYSEAAEKVAEWEKAKEEIKVGDIVEDGLGSIALSIRNAGGMLYLVFSDGSCGRHEPESWHKTGRHIDVDSFLKQIGEK